MALTASHTSTAYSSSVPVYDSGEYSKRHWVLGYFLASSTHILAPSVAMALTASRSARNTTRRCRIDVRVIISARDWVSAWIVTSSGNAAYSMIARTKSKSVFDAEGKPTSNSL